MKKILYLLLSLLIVLSVGGCGSTQANTDPKPQVQTTQTPEVFVENILKQDIAQQYDKSYNQLHPDDQAEYTREEYISDNKANAPFIETIKDYKVGASVILPTWVNSKGSGKEYKDVAEVSYTLNFKDGKTANANMHLAKASDGGWRSFSSPTNKQIDIGKASELGQFEFKVLKAENTKEAKTPTKSISVTTNTYEIIKLEVINKRSAPSHLQDFKLQLKDLDKNILYDMNSEVSGSLNISLKIYDKVPAVNMYDDMNPNLKNELSAVFEVPADGNYALVVSYQSKGLLLKLK